MSRRVVPDVKYVILNDDCEKLKSCSTWILLVSSEDIVWGKRHRQRNHQPQLLVTKKRIPLQPAKHAYVEYQHGEGIFNCSTNQHCYTVHLMTRTATKAGSSMFKPCA